MRNTVRIAIGCLTIIILAITVVSISESGMNLRRVRVDIIIILALYYYYQWYYRSATLKALRSRREIPQADIEVSGFIQKQITLLNQDLLGIVGEGSRKRLSRFEGKIHDVRLKRDRLVGDYHSRRENYNTKDQYEYREIEKAWVPKRMNIDGLSE